MSNIHQGPCLAHSKYSVNAGIYFYHLHKLCPRLVQKLRSLYAPWHMAVFHTAGAQSLCWLLVKLFPRRNVRRNAWKNYAKAVMIVKLSGDSQKVKTLSFETLKRKLPCTLIRNTSSKRLLWARHCAGCLGMQWGKGQASFSKGVGGGGGMSR